MVASGQVDNRSNISNKVHNRSIPSGHAKVSINVVYESDAPLPVPNEDDDQYTVGAALGTYVAWPISLIDMNYKVLEMDFFLQYTLFSIIIHC